MAPIKVVISLQLPDVYIKKIQDVSPNVTVMISRDPNELLRMIPDADVLFAMVFSREVFLAAKNLRWIQTFFAGVERYLLPEVVKSNVVVTSAGGVNSTAVSEHAIAMMLSFCRRLHFFVRDQTEGKWNRSSAELMWQLEELPGKTLGLLGLGKIGLEVARKAKCLGMNVIATRRSPSAPKPDFVDRMFPAQELKTLLAESDFVVLAMPLTRETEGVIGEAELRSMKKTVYLINVSRGKIVQENKLVQALEEGWVAGAGLDAFETEPLPENSPLWKMQNVIITPHMAGLTPHYLERLTDLFCENLKRFMRGEDLINVVDKARGY